MKALESHTHKHFCDNPLIPSHNIIGYPSSSSGARLKTNPTDAAGQEKMQLRELKNARVAMIGFAGLFVNHFMPGAVPGLGGFH